MAWHDKPFTLLARAIARAATDSQQPITPERLARLGLRADMAGRDGDTLLIVAVQNRRMDMVQALIQGGADPLLANRRCGNALHCAVEHGDLASLLLIAKPQHLEATGRGGMTALGMAVRFGHVECAQALLDLGADIDARDGEGRSAAMRAAAARMRRTLTLLLDRGAQVHPLLDLDDMMRVQSQDAEDAREGSSRSFATLIESHLLARATPSPVAAPRAVLRG